MCDVQILTGLGILISGYADLRCGISAYHFLLIGSVAWFSNLTHVAGLTVLRRYLSQRSTEKRIRQFFMVVLSLMLLAAMGPTIFFDWAHKAYYNLSVSFPGSHAICFFDTARLIEWHFAITGWGVQKSRTFQSAVVSMLLIFFNLSSRMIKLEPTLSRTVKKARKQLSDRYKAHTVSLYGQRTTPRIKARWIWEVMTKTQITNLIVARIYTDLLTSTLSDVSSPTLSKSAFSTISLSFTLFSKSF